MSLLCRHYEQGGFSTLAVESPRVEMAELLDRVIKKRRLQMHGTSRDCASTCGSTDFVTMARFINTAKELSIIYFLMSI